MNQWRFVVPGLLVAGFFLTPPLRGAAPDSSNSVQAGALLFRDKGCGYCHGANGTGTPRAPSLADIRNDKNWPPEKITDQILNGGKKMPPFRESLSDEEIAQIVSWLRAKNRPSPPPAPAETSPR